MHASENLEEADRLMTVCNSCRYCEGLCPVFPAMELRRVFTDGDLNYLANLCHNCGACYVDCQFSPPHEFNVNVPQVLAKVRADSYRSYAWPKALQPLFDSNGLVIATISAISMAGFVLGFALWHDPGVLFTGGSFYRLMPHTVMASLFMAVSALALLALVMGFRNFWRDSGAVSVSRDDTRTLWQAFKDVATLRYLDGGGPGCYAEEDEREDRRKLFHHLTFYGFMLCFASTVTASGMHYGLDTPAPYSWTTLPKLLGIPGGIGLVIGPIGLLYAKFRRDPQVQDTARFGMDTGFIVMLLLSGLSGLLLMVLRETPAMGIFLAFHLGTIFALFLTMPYGKFVHGFYRFGALLIYARERRSGNVATAQRGSE